MIGWRERLRDAMVVAVVLGSLVCATPAWLVSGWVPGWDALQGGVRTAWRAMGIEQGNYRLFGPHPDRANDWIEVKLVFSDGQRATWTSWDWQRRGVLERVARTHAPKWVERVADEDQKILHRGLARWARRNLRPPVETGARPVQVVILRHRWWVPPAGPARERQRARFGRLPPPREAHPHTTTLHRQRFRPRGGS